MPESQEYINKLNEHLSLQEKLKGVLAPSLVDAAIALIQIQIRELTNLVPRSLFTEPNLAPPRVVWTPEPTSHKAIVRLLMGIALADDMPKLVQLNELRRILEDQLGLDQDEMERANAWIEEIRDDMPGMDPEQLVQDVVKLTEPDPEFLYGLCLQVAMADDDLCDSEQTWLYRIAQSLDVSADTSRKLHANESMHSQQRLNQIEARRQGQYGQTDTVRFGPNGTPPVSPEVELQSKQLSSQVTAMESSPGSALPKWMSPSLEETTRDWTPWVYEGLVANAAGRNVTEWCKKPNCWIAVQQLPVSAPISSA